MILRKIVIGLITSTDYIRRVRGIWDISLVDTDEAAQLARWCLDYYDKYDEAPKKNIEDIYFQAVKDETVERDIASDIQEILDDLNGEYLEESINTKYLIEKTQEYFNEVRLEKLTEDIGTAKDRGDIEEAQRLALDYTPVTRSERDTVDLSSLESLQAVKQAFKEATKPVFKYPKHLGKYLNQQLVKGGFVAVMSPEKRGKTFLLMDMAIRASRQGCNVVFFQAGDMNQNQQIRRFCINIAQKSDLDKYCKAHYQPVVDCVKNQLDTCEKEQRECDFGIFDEHDENYLRYEITKEEIVEAFKDFPDYEPCYNCREFKNRELGCAWLKKIDKVNPLEEKEALELFENYFIKKNCKIKLSTHPNNTLSVKEIKSILTEWEKQEKYIADVIIIDYADLLVSGYGMSERDKQNAVWKDLRNLSQENNQPLVITATQTDANSYERNLLNLQNFSEDKRKYSHVTAFYGLNQDKDGREKEIGIMRINELLLREGEFSSKNVCYILQNLKRGRPYVGSYF